MTKPLCPNCSRVHKPSWVRVTRNGKGDTGWKAVTYAPAPVRNTHAAAMKDACNHHQPVQGGYRPW